MFSSLLSPDGSPSSLGAFYALDSSFNADVANKRMYTSLTRLATTVGNYPIRGIILYDGYSPRPTRQYGGIAFPNGLFPKKDYTGAAIGTGDGVITQFDFPVSFVKSGSETIYVGGVAKTRNVDYTVRYGMKSTDTLLLDRPDSVFKLVSYAGVTFEDIALLPQPAGEEAIITSIALKNGSLTSERMVSYNIKLSTDGVNWVDAGSSSPWYAGMVATLNSFTPAAYKYIKATFVTGAGGGSLAYIRIYATPPATKHITFTTPPASGAAITADFSTEYINKTSNFMLDVQAEVLFGEGV